MTGTEYKALDFLAGGGEMGERIRNFDWSKTPLGAPEKWHQSLKTSVSICLNSNFPIALYWGVELVLIYNDAWSSIPGNKHPWALGKPAREAWVDIWSDIEPEFEKAFKGIPGGSKDALLPMQRHGYTEECYFDFTFTPVNGESGEVEGVFNAVIETTYRILNERHTAFLAGLTQLLATCTAEMEIFNSVIRFAGKDNKSIPFALLYSASEGKNELVLSTHQDVDCINLQCEWPFENIPSGEKTFYINNLQEYFRETPKGYWPEAPVEAVIIPVRMGDVSHFIICGINARHRYDAEFKTFFETIANIITNALNRVVSFEAERKRAEALAEIDKAKTLFFTNISHEFRTPITLILGTIEEALHDGATTGINKERMAVANRNAIRLLKLVNTLLDFSRIESGRIEANYVLTDIAGFTKNLASNFRSVMEKVGLTLNITTEGNIKPVFVDRQMYEKIVFNLLSNAFKYTLEGGITITLSATDTHVILKVSDTGIGIPEKELPFMFDRFHRIESTSGRTFEGTGIGLSFTKELVQLHGGNISVESEQGTGSTFTIEIPFGKAHLPEMQIRTSDDHFDSESAEAYVDETLFFDEVIVNSTSNVTQDAKSDEVILVVDDNADMRYHIKSLVEKNYTVITAANGADALREINENTPSLVLSDIMMPVMNGIELLKEIKNNQQTQNIPVILLTARAGEESKIEGYEIGADDYLVKPFSSKELIARIRGQLKIRQKQREALESIEAMNASLETKIAERTTDLTKANRELESFNYIASHDLQEPLRKIQTFISLIRDTDLPKEQKEKYFEKIDAAAKRMTTLIQSVLIYSRISNTQEQYSDVDLNQVLEEVKTDFELAILEKGATINSNTLPTVKANVLQVNQLFSNLIGNSLKFSKDKPHIDIEGEVVKAVQIENYTGTNPDQKFVHLSFSDNGIGFDPIHKEQIFSLFQRLHGKHEFAGTGIGLSIVKRIIEQHGGYISATSKPGEGATFHIWLPF